MAAGTAVHAVLEAEVTTVLTVAAVNFDNIKSYQHNLTPHAFAFQTVDIDVTTVEDAWAVRLMDMLTGLHQLQWEGMTREMYIWGNVEARQLCASLQLLQFKLTHEGPCRDGLIHCRANGYVALLISLSWMSQDGSKLLKTRHGASLHCPCWLSRRQPSFRWASHKHDTCKNRTFLILADALKSLLHWSSR